MKTPLQRVLYKISFAFGLSFIPGLLSAAVAGSAFPPYGLFAPLQADWSEPHFAFALGAPVSGDGIARINVGDGLGLYRWNFSPNISAQLNISGSIFTRFEAVKSHNLQVIDFYGNVPFDLRFGKLSMRILTYHVSSHLGDDYLRAQGITGQLASWEALRVLLSYPFFSNLRVYGGYGKAFHTVPAAWRGPNSVQGGAEIYWPMPKNARLHPFWANDVQAWERSAWNPTWTSQIGLKTDARGSSGRGIIYFAQVTTGPRLEGQFYPERETIWAGGLKFIISSHLP